MNIQNNRTKIYNCAYLTTQEKSETEIRYRDRFVLCFAVKTAPYQVKKALVKHQAVVQKKVGGRLLSCIVMQRQVHVVQQYVMSEQDCWTMCVLGHRRKRVNNRLSLRVGWE